MSLRTALLRALALVAALLVCTTALLAVAQQQAVVTVTDDQVNAIAKKLYCPVCENITLDTCGTSACADWRYEIRLQLEQGRTEDEIIADFVQRFGDRVVGTPMDSALRTLSLVTPWVISAGVLLILGSMVLTRQRKARVSATSPAPAISNPPAQKYQDMIEQDLEG